MRKPGLLRNASIRSARRSLLLLGIVIAASVAPVGAAVNCSAAGIVCKAGTLGDDETWVSSNLYVVTGHLTVPAGKMLTIQAGVIVKFDDPLGNYNLLVAGHLQVDGGTTPATRVYFTGTKDDTVGGDTNNDGSNSSSAPGDWGAVVFQPDSTGAISNAELRYAGGSNSAAAVYLDGSSPTLDGLSVKNSVKTAISALATDTPVIHAFTCSGTHICGLEIRGGALTGDTAWNTTWLGSGITYVLTGSLTIPVGRMLTIASGVVVKFDDPLGNYDVVVAGHLQINGAATPSTRVYLTGIRDDTFGGDTNSDGSSSSSGPGDWGAIVFQPDSTGAISNAELRYAGGSNGAAAVYLDGSSPTLNGLTVKNSVRTAISALATDTPDIHAFSCSGTQICGLEIRSGALTGDATWSTTWLGSGITYVLTGSLTVPTARKLRITSGVVVKFADPLGNYDIVVAGRLEIEGGSSAESRVYLTAHRDDTYGGDTDSNGASSGAPGDWGAIAFQPGSTGSIQNAELRYGGGSSGAASIYLSGSSPSLSTLAVKSSQHAAISALATDAPTITGFTCEASPVCGLEIRTVALNTNASWSNAWASSGIAYVPAADFTISVGATLTIGPGVIVKFPASLSDYTLSAAGGLVVNGVAGARTYFTVLTDDSVGGDTNGNGASTGSTGAWGGLEFPTGGGGLLDHAVVRYADHGVYSSGGSVQFLNGELRFNTNGVYNTSPTLVEVHRTSLVGNTAYAAYAAFGQPGAPGVDARWNWWGTSSCPLTTGENRVSAPPTVTVEPCSAAEFVDYRPTQTALSSSLNPSEVGQEVTLETTVSAATGCPTGSVRFLDGPPGGATQLGISTLGTCSGTAATASLKKRDFSPGTHAIHVEYDGDATFVYSVSNTLSQSVVVPPPLDYYTVPPCRAVDTRVPGLGAPALVGGVARTFQISGGDCGVPITAKAAVFNFTVTGATGNGNCRLYPDPLARPEVSSINFTPGLTRANNAVIALAPDGTVTVYCVPSPSTHVILDVSGYFE